MKALWMLPLMALSLPAQAQQPRAPGACFDVIFPASGAQVHAILVDRCTGQTWQLVRTSTEEDEWTFRWSPIIVNKNEARLSFPKSKPAPPFQPQPPQLPKPQ